MEDEITINLRQYIDVVVRRWRMIVSLTLVVTIVAGLFALASLPGYEAVAGVAIVKIKTNVEFDPRFTTTSQDLEGTGAAQATIAEARRSALVGLVENGDIAGRVIDKLGDQLESGVRNPATLIGKVSAVLVQKGDLIQIKVIDKDPTMAALIANTWAQEYELYINAIYGGGGSAEYASSIQAESERVRQQYEQAQTAVEAFIAQSRIDDLTRSISETQHIIDSLQDGKQTAVVSVIDEEMKARKDIITAYISAQTKNRLLAFDKEQESKRMLLAGFINAETDARLTAFEKDQEARVKQFAQYVDAEINNRLAAFDKEQQAKRDLFAAYADADSRAKMGVFNKQVEAKLQTLAGYYETRLKLERLLADARSLQSQVRQGGDASAATNNLAILLLKAEAYASSAGLPGNLQLQLDGVGGLGVGATAQVADLQALIDALEKRIADLDAAIAKQSQEVFNNQGYDLLTAERPEDDPLYAALKGKYGDLFAVDELAQAADLAPQGSDLAGAILTKYDELFGVGSLGKMATVVSPTTPIFTVIQEQYPDLFTMGDLSQLTEDMSLDNPLTAAANQKDKELLQLKDLESLPAYSIAAEPLTQAIDELQKDIRAMQAELEQQNATQQSLVQTRNLAWETYTTMARKQSEASISTAVTGSEVRFASKAVPPISRASSRLPSVLAAIGLGIFLGVLGAFGIEYLGIGLAPRILGRPEAVWNRVLGWVMAEGPGLPAVHRHPVDQVVSGTSSK